MAVAVGGNMVVVVMVVAVRAVEGGVAGRAAVVGVVVGGAVVARAVVAVEDRGAVRVAGAAKVDRAEAAATGKVRRESEYSSHGR